MDCGLQGAMTNTIKTRARTRTKTKNTPSGCARHPFFQKGNLWGALNDGHDKNKKKEETMKVRVIAEKIYYKGDLYLKNDIVNIDAKDNKINKFAFEEIKEPVKTEK
jgi:hypothetical protein